jgi:hypothetical protein
MKKLIINESQYDRIKRYLNEIANRSYIFDWDDNILFMPTKIKMDKNEGGNWVPVDVSTEEFAQVRTSPEYRLRNNDPVVAFEDFKLTDSFLHDTVEAISNESFAPSFEKFKEALIYGNKFAINTARGHKPEALKQGVKTFIDLIFSDEEEQTMVNNIRKNIPQDVPGYQKLKAGSLNNDQVIDLYLNEFGEYYPVSSEEFGERFGLDTTGGAANPEHAKKVAIEHFTQKVLRNVQKLVDSGHYTKVSIGFSDDDIRNVRASEEFLENELKHMYPEIHFVVYDTSEGGKKKLVIEKE